MDALLASSMTEAFLGSKFTWIASHFPKVCTHSWRDAAPARAAAAGRKFPVVLFSHGNISTRVQNTALLEELASHGFVCAACDHPHDAAIVNYPNGAPLVTACRRSVLRIFAALSATLCLVVSAPASLCPPCDTLWLVCAALF